MAKLKLTFEMWDALEWDIQKKIEQKAIEFEDFVKSTQRVINSEIRFKGFTFYESEKIGE